MAVMVVPHPFPARVWLSTAQTAERLGCSERTLRRMRDLRLFGAEGQGWRRVPGKGINYRLDWVETRWVIER